MAEGKNYRVAGFEVHFPHEAYGVQKVFMNQVLRAIHNEENALLEAPTGCGKTLSLLCGALAWQDAQKRKKTAAEQLQKEKRDAAAADAKAGTCLAPLKQNSTAADEVTSDVDEPEDPSVEIRVPKIYYATRTHSQIAQVVRELKRTSYRPRMAVLGSRPHYCINKTALRSKQGVDAACEDMLKEQQGCRFKKNAMTLNHGLVKIHDIEDLAKIGSRHKACPYFGSRHLAESADLIFCPYSYLLDPNIRRATKIQASDSILIFDEAHNIEDQAREAGSIDLDIDKLKKSFLGLYQASCMSSESEAYEPLKAALLQVINWLLRLGEGGPKAAGFRDAGFERFERLWTGQQMLDALAEAGLAPQSVEHLWTCYEKARAAEDKAGFNTEGDAANQSVSSDITTPRAGGAALGYVSSLLTALRLLYGSYSEASSLQEEQQQPPGAAGGASKAVAAPLPAAKVAQLSGGDNVPDYRLAVHMWVDREGGRGRSRGRERYATSDTTAEEFAAAAPGTTSTEWAMSFGVWCLNPSVVFRCLSEVARSVLLASGTLSPLDTFSGELGLNFHVKLEAPHVVNMQRQVMARVVSHGPDGRQLCATFKEADKLDYQDSLGRLVLEVVNVVPDGVLLFLPSYMLMDKLTARWKATGVWAEIEHLKHIVTEPRKAGEEFDAAIAQYYKAVQHQGGGLFMAVCRGKASEGIDFADGNARCVIVVGIPFPNVKDSKVGLKKDYNNASATRPGFGNRPGGLPMQLGPAAASGAPPKLLSGDQWYSQQAFRALNQAVGRCIRHRYDYGAILLVDERFRQPRHQQCLSKWVRGAIATAADTPKLINELKGFFKGLQANPPSAAAAAALEEQGKVQPPAIAAAAGLIKPGYEAEPVPSKRDGTGREAGPVLEPGTSSKPGYEAAAAGTASSVPWHLQDGFDSRMRSKGGHEMAYGSSSKPGYEAAACSEPCKSADVGCGQGGAAGTADCGSCASESIKSRRQTASWQHHGSMQQQQQQIQQGEQQEVVQQQPSGPMDMFVVKQGMQQQQQHVRTHLHQTKEEPQQQQQQQHAWQPAQQQHSWGQQQQQCPSWQQYQHGGQQQSGQLKQEPKQCEHHQTQQPQQQQQQVVHTSAQQVLPAGPAAAPQPQRVEHGQPPTVGSRIMPISMQPQQRGDLCMLRQQQQTQDHNSQQQQQQPAVVRPVSCMSMLGGAVGHWPAQQQQRQQQEPCQQQQQVHQQEPQQQTGNPDHQPPAQQQLHNPPGHVVTEVVAIAAEGKPCTSTLDTVVPQTPPSSTKTAPLSVAASDAVGRELPAGVLAASPAPAAAAGKTAAKLTCDEPHDQGDAAAAAQATVPTGDSPRLGIYKAPTADTTALGHAAVVDASSSAAVKQTGVDPERSAAAAAATGALEPAGQPATEHHQVATSMTAASNGTVSALASSGSISLADRCRMLQLPTSVLQQWVSADVSGMTQQLRYQGVSEEGAEGCGMHELVCFGILGAFELASDICHQQQQQAPWQNSGQGLAAALSQFWPVWHSYLPLGLLAVAAAAQQLPPAQQQQQQQQGLSQQIQQVQGAWLGAMQRRSLLDNLCHMAEAYDQVLDLTAQQPQRQEQQRQDLPPVAKQAMPYASLQGQMQQPLLAGQQQSAHAQSQQAPCWQQQRPWQQQSGSRGGPQWQSEQQHWQRQENQQLAQYQRQQQQQQTWQQQHQHHQPWPNDHAAAAVCDARMPCATPGVTVLSEPPRPVTGVLELSQTARQPKRSAHRSDKAQLAAQKRSKQSQSARLAAAVPPSKVASNGTAAVVAGAAKASTPNIAPASEDDDDFM